MNLRVVTDRVAVQTRGDAHMLDLTGPVAEVVARHGLEEGHVLIFVPGSTAALTTIEYEPGLVEDFPALFDRIAPQDLYYGHEETWHDGNGHSHVRASLVGPSLVVPVDAGQLVLGTWQQVLLVDFDNRPRSRQIVVQLQGAFA